MKTIAILLSISALIVNCKGADSSGSVTSISAELNDFIPNNKAELGPLAQDLIDNDAKFNEWFHAKDANGNQLYGDLQMLNGAKAWINMMHQQPDMYSVCAASVALLQDFTIPAEIVQISGTNHSIVTNGAYCLVEITLSGEPYVYDPMLNNTFVADSSYPQWDDIDPRIRANGIKLSAQHLMDAIAAGLADKIVRHPDGFSNAPLEWQPANGTYYHCYENNFSGNAQYVDFLEAVFVNVL